jgi:hypothetical protein
MPMTEFYEFHDSTLLDIKYFDSHLVLVLDAYKHLRPQGLDNPGTGWWQLIEITVDEPAVEYEFTSFPVEIYHGSFRGVCLNASPDDIVGEEIPASLTGASEVEIYLEGLEQTKNSGMNIKGKSASITQRQEARFAEDLNF